MHDRPTPRKQQARSFGRGGHQRLFVTIKNENHVDILSSSQKEESP